MLNVHESPEISKHVFKKDEKKEFTAEQIQYAKSFKDVEIEIEDNAIILHSLKGDLIENVASEIANKFPNDLKVNW